MSEAIGPGDWVECIFDGEDIPKGTVLFCLDVITVPGSGCDNDPYCVAPGLVLKDAPHPDEDAYWCGCGFRPIYRPKASIIQSLLQPAPTEPVTA